MKLELTGVVHEITPMYKPNPQKDFIRRDLYIDCTGYDRYTGQRSEYENFPRIEFNNAKAAMLDGINLGDVVTVTFEIQGRFYNSKSLNPDGTPIVKHANSINGYDIKVVKSVAPEPSVPEPMPTPAVGQSPQYDIPDF